MISKKEFVIRLFGIDAPEIKLKEGYTKPFNEVFYEMLPMCQERNLQAKNNLKGLYLLVNNF